MRGTYTISGKVISASHGNGIPNLRIEAWDKDMLVDDFLAETESDDHGNFTLEFALSRYKELFLDKKPDVYFKIYEGQRLLKSTIDAEICNMDGDIKGLEIVIDLAAPPAGTPTPASGENPYTITGQVFQNGKVLANAVVRAFDQDLPGKKVPRWPLGSPVSTNKDGRFTITYDEAQFKRSENLSADLVITVSEKKGELLYTTPVQFNVPQEFTIEIRFDTESEYAGAVEFEQYLSRVKPLLGDELSVEQLTDADIAFLSNESGIAVAHLNALHTAFLMQKETGIASSFFYGLFRRSLPVNIGSWLVYQPADLVEFFQAAIKEHIVSEYSAEDLLRFAQEVLKIAIRRSIDTPVGGGNSINPASIGDILGTVIADTDKQMRFLELYHNFKGDRGDFWKELADHAEFHDQAEQIAFTLQLAKISFNNIKLINAVHTAPTLNQINDLVALEVEDWQDILLKNNVDIPAHIFGVDDEQKAKNYALSISGLLEGSFPNDFVARAVQKQGNASAEIIGFLQNKESGFSITRTPVDTYLSSDKGMDAFANIQDQKEAIAGLKHIQRIYNITGDSKLMSAFMQMGVNSAHQLASMPLAQYMQVMGSSGIETQTLLAVHARATQITETNVVLLKELQNYYRGVLPGILNGPAAPPEAITKGIPDYEALFGALDYCECGHCRSVYSATAYFVELLHELLGGKFAATDPSLANPVRALFAHRPDLQFIKLTCENTETEIPYLDIVNEILETYIGTGGLDEAHTRDTSSFTAEELAANPQFIVDEAHVRLRAAFYPLNMPFDIHLETAREYFKYLGSSRYEVLSTFSPGTATATRKNERLAEAISLSAKEFEILTQVTFAGVAAAVSPHTLYGYADSTLPLGNDQRLKKAAAFLEKVNITYNDLLAILKTTFVNPLWHLADYLQDPTINEIPAEQAARMAFIAAHPALIANVESSVIVLSAPVTAACDLRQTNIVFKNNTTLTDDDYAKINRFIRLWKKLGCSIEETDLLLTSLSDNGRITALTIQRIANACLINSSLNLPIEKLVCLWGNMPHIGPGSLYQKLFLNKAALKIDAAYQLNTQQTELSETSKLINNHVPALLAAFKVSEEEMNAIRKYMRLDGGTAVLSIAVISALCRFTILAKSTRLSVFELLGVMHLLPSADPFDINAMENTQGVVDMIRQINESGFSLEQLRFLYQSQPGNDAAFLPKPGAIRQLAKTIAEGLAKLTNDHAKKEFVRNSWSTAFHLEETMMKSLLANLPAIETSALGLTLKNTTDTPGMVPDDEDFASLSRFAQSYQQLSKIALLINVFGLKSAELEHFIANAADFEQFNLADIPLSFHEVYSEKGFRQWRRLADYNALKRQLGIADESLVEVFSQPDFQKMLIALKNATNWEEGKLKDLAGTALGEGVFGATAADYKNEKMLLRFAAAMQLSAKQGLSIKKLASWTSAVDEVQGMDIKNTLRAKYEDSGWFEIAKKVNSALREKNRDALVSYLLTLPAIKNLNIRDTNDLYAYFLIDVEMQSCMMTSRIVQANASVQLFVQRCLMNLEQDVAPGEINESRWKWMKKYRVWEANRKVFLYPENWIEPEWRDDKSPFFKELESSLLQAEVTNDNVEKALREYLDQLDSVARLDVRAMHEDTEQKELHVIARTFNIPYTYFYRRFSTKTNVWTAWCKVETDIEGDNLCMTVWNRRLLLFWLSKTEKTRRQTSAQRLAGHDPVSYTEVRLNWSEYKQEHWLPKKMSTSYIEANIDFIYPSITIDNTLEIICGSGAQENSFFDLASNPSRTEIGVFHTGFSWRETGKFTFDSCHSKCTTSTARATGTTNTQDGFEEITNLGGLSLVLRNNMKKVLDADSGSYLNRLTTQSHIPKFVPGDHFFIGGGDRNYFVKTSSYTLPLMAIPLIPAAASLPDFRDYLTHQPWNDSTLPRLDFKWDAPLGYQTPYVGSLNTQLPREIFQNQSINNAAASLIAKINNDLTAQSLVREIPVASDYRYNRVAAVERYGFSPLSSPAEPGFQFFSFYHSYVCDFVKSLNAGGIDALLETGSQSVGERDEHGMPIADNDTDFRSRYRPQSNVAFPYPHELVDFSEGGAYSQYNWELFFHVPMLIANRLSKNQRFEEALRWYHFVFNPMSATNESSPERFWNVLPFKITPAESMQQLFAKLQLPDGNAEKEALKNQVEQWRDNPFNPHLLARMRLIAYMKNVVMKYLDNLFSWGDSLFRSETRESVMEAIQIYMLAADILGSKPSKVSMRGKTSSENYHTLKAKLDAFQNAAVRMETFFPNYSESPVSNSMGSLAPGLTNIVQAFYFCIPDNDKLLAYWDRLTDRLFKVRHCQNIEGLALKLSLFEPQIDPALLMQATARGLDIGSILTGISASSPLYKFQYMLQRSMEFTSELKTIAGSLLSAIEKQDAEEFSVIRAQHESTMLHLIKETKKMQYQEAVNSKENILKTRDNIVARWQHYSKLLGIKEPAVPAVGDIVKSVPVPEDASVVEEVRQVSSFESQDLNKSASAAGFQVHAGIYETISGIMHAIPNWNVAPAGVGPTFGGSNLGAIAGAYASGFRTASNISNVDAARAAKLGGYFRREQEWALQCNSAANEIMAIDKQLLIADIRIDIAAKERNNHDKQIENAQQVEQFIRSKYSNRELYSWMQGEIATLYFQAYQIAFDLARKTELAYRYELGIEHSDFVRFGSWDSFRKGLLAGEKLSLSLRQMENAFIESNKRHYEITKHVSLASLDPLALIKLKTTGACKFEIPEAIYDMDNPGHYFRRIKSVSVSLPCIAGPYTSVNAKLSLSSSRYRKNTNEDEGYTEVSGIDPDSRFVYQSHDSQFIATSHGQNDSGVFELSFRDERYVPFEGAGAISNWDLELPTEVKLFDYNTIADVILHVKYTAREGGDLLKNAANRSIRSRLNQIRQAIGVEGLHFAVDVKHDLPNEWHILKATRSVNIKLDKSRLPYMVQAMGMVVGNVQFVAKADVVGDFVIKVENTDVSLGSQLTLKIGAYNGNILPGVPFSVNIPVGQDISKLEELIMVVNYKFG